MKVMRKSELVSHLAAKAGIRKKAVATVLDELQTLASGKSNGRSQVATPGLAKAVKLYRNPREGRDKGRDTGTGEIVKIETKPRPKFRRAATSDEVFAALAKAFSFQ